jgi:hypothetical protein
MYFLSPRVRPTCPALSKLHTLIPFIYFIYIFIYLYAVIVQLST